MHGKVKKYSTHRANHCQPASVDVAFSLRRYGIYGSQMPYLAVVNAASICRGCSKQHSRTQQMLTQQFGRSETQRLLRQSLCLLAKYARACSISTVGSLSRCCVSHPNLSISIQRPESGDAAPTKFVLSARNGTPWAAYPLNIVLLFIAVVVYRTVLKMLTL